jgi:hypothetical protein
MLLFKNLENRQIANPQTIPHTYRDVAYINMLRRLKSFYLFTTCN